MIYCDVFSKLFPSAQSVWQRQLSKYQIYHIVRNCISLPFVTDVVMSAFLSFVSGHLNYYDDDDDDDQLHKTPTLVYCIDNVDQVDESYMNFILPQNGSKAIELRLQPECYEHFDQRHWSLFSTYWRYTNKIIIIIIITNTFFSVVVCRRLSQNYNLDWALESGRADKVDVCLMVPLLTLMQVLV